MPARSPSMAGAPHGALNDNRPICAMRISIHAASAPDALEMVGSYMYMSRRPTKHTGTIANISTIANINTCIGRDDQQNWAETASIQQQIQNWAETASKQLRDCGGVTLRLRPC